MPELLTRLIRAATGAAAQINFPSDESVQFPGWMELRNSIGYGANPERQFRLGDRHAAHKDC